MCLSSLNELDRGEVMDDLSREAARAGKRVWHAPGELSTLDNTEPDALTQKLCWIAIKGFSRLCVTPLRLRHSSHRVVPLAVLENIF